MTRFLCYISLLIITITFILFMAGVCGYGEHLSELYIFSLVIFGVVISTQIDIKGSSIIYPLLGFIVGLGFVLYPLYTVITSLILFIGCIIGIIIIDKIEKLTNN